VKDGPVRAAFLRVRGTVQGVGFRPFVHRLATAQGLTGWVRNSDAGVEIHIEGADAAVDAFTRSLVCDAPAAARIAGDLDRAPAVAVGFDRFVIRESELRSRPTAAISPDLPVCVACLAELCDPGNRRHGYPFINCTACGPRFSIIESLPYDRSRTTMSGWSMCADCRLEYLDPRNRRFHAEPIACSTCGPQYRLVDGQTLLEGDASIREAAARLREGRILAVKGVGGYHLVCDAANASTIAALRVRKYRKERAFALMAKDLCTARVLVYLNESSEAVLTSPARPIVLAPPRLTLIQVAPDHPELGVMLPYTPLHHLLFACGAPEVLVMTSGNRSTEPIAYEDTDARDRLAGIADAFLMGDRPIARRVDDSIARVGAFGPMILRRSRGLAPGAVARVAKHGPILAVGADLKNTITVAVDGEAFVSQHLGDLDQYHTRRAFEHTIADLLKMYGLEGDELMVVHDGHPEYASTRYALERSARSRLAVQHHRAHVASVLAERNEFDARVIGVAFDGTGYGDDGTIWGGEWFAGSLTDGLRRVAHVRTFTLPGGDAAARHPVQAAAGVLDQLDHTPDMTAWPFSFSREYRHAQQLLQQGVRTFPSTSVGRLFDAVAALLGFTRAITFEGQAAVWLEYLASTATHSPPLPFRFVNGELDYRPALDALIARRIAGENPAAIARAFHVGLAAGLTQSVSELCESHGIDTVVLSGGVFQNALLLHVLREMLDPAHLRVWTNSTVPPNDGGISLGQAALASVACVG
jgi:hydrogenase maturation protein HypF